MRNPSTTGVIPRKGCVCDRWGGPINRRRGRTDLIDGSSFGTRQGLCSWSSQLKVFEHAGDRQLYVPDKGDHIAIEGSGFGISWTSPNCRARHQHEMPPTCDERHPIRRQRTIDGHVLLHLLLRRLTSPSSPCQNLPRNLQQRGAHISAIPICGGPSWIGNMISAGA